MKILFGSFSKHMVVLLYEFAYVKSNLKSTKMLYRIPKSYIYKVAACRELMNAFTKKNTV